MKDKENWIPFRIVLHKDVIEDEQMCKKEGSWYIIDIAVPEECSNSMILSSNWNPPTEEEMLVAELQAYEFFVINNVDLEKEIEEDNN